MITNIVDEQYRRPSGILGWLIGNRMARDHRPENLWTISVLHVAPTDRILEIGSGAGAAIRELSQVVTQGQIVGIDFSTTMVQAARRRNAAAIKRGRVDLRHNDAADLPFADNTFDKAFSIHSIYFWPRPLKAMTEAWRVLKPAGLFAITVLPKEKWNAGDLKTLVGTPRCRPYSGDELTELLVAAGFGRAYIQSDSNPVHRSNFTVIGVK